LRWKNGPIPLSTKVRWDDKQLKAARKGIDTFLEEISLNQREELSCKGKGTHLLRAFGTIEQIFTENLERLLAPSVEVQTPKGKRVIKLERTNNGVEQDFRSIRRHGRRLKGNKDVEELIQKEGVGLLLLLIRFLMGPTVDGCYRNKPITTINGWIPQESSQQQPKTPF